MPRANEPRDQLSPDDSRLLDELVDAGFDPARLEGSGPAGRDRAARIARLIELLDDYPVEDGDETLVHATLARIDRYESERSARLSFEERQEEATVARPRRRIPIPDFISVAAVVLIALGITLPIARHVRQRSVDMACLNNLRYVGYAMSNYAGDNDHALPMAIAGANVTWDSVTNIVNLAPLLAGHYCEQGHLECPGAEDHERGRSDYSYQCQTPGERVVWGSGPTFVLGDRNPLIDAFWSGLKIDPRTISFNHGGRGQNVLGSDGGTLWLEEPVIGPGDDNIWLPSGLTELRAGARPAGAGDVFLTH